MNAETLSFAQLCELFNYTPKCRPLSNKEAAELLHFQPNTLEIKRLNGTGPRYFQPPGTRRVLYSEKDVLAWLASGARTSTSQPACV
jgi:hypothetical protein